MFRVLYLAHLVLGSPTALPLLSVNPSSDYAQIILKNPQFQATIV